MTNGWADMGDGTWSKPHELGVLRRSPRKPYRYWIEDHSGNRISQKCGSLALALASIPSYRDGKATPMQEPQLTDEDLAVLFGEIRIAPTVDLTYATTARELLRAIQAQLHPSRTEYQVAEILVGPLVELLRGLAMDRRYPGEEVFADLQPISPAHIPMLAGVPSDILDLPTAPITWRGNR